MASKAEQLRKEQGEIMRQSVGKSPAAGQARPAIPARQVRPRELGVSRAEALEIEVDRIMPDPDQPRKNPDPEKIERMARSLKARGQLQPIMARWSESQGMWVIVAGERRYRGAVLAGLKTLRVVERKGPPDTGDILVDQLIENIMREDLEPIEEGRAFRQLMELNGWSGNQLAQELAISQPRVVERLALLDAPESIRDMVALGELSSSSAYEIGKLQDPDAQEAVARQAVDEGLRRDEVRQVVKRVAAKSPASKAQSGKGRGVRAQKKSSAPKTWTRRMGGFKVTVESSKGVDPEKLPELFRELIGGLSEAG